MEPRPGKTPHTPRTVAKEAPAPVLTATLDYRNWTTERSEQSRPRPTDHPASDPGALDLTIELPIGTEDGSFHGPVPANNDESVAEATGTATWDGTAEVLR